MRTTFTPPLAQFAQSYNPSTNNARGPVANNLSRVSNTNRQMVRKDADLLFNTHQRSVTDLINRAALLLKDEVNTGATDIANNAQRSASSSETRQTPAGVAQESPEASRTTLNAKIAAALRNLPSGTTFSTNKAETAKQALLNEFKQSPSSFAKSKKMLDTFTSILEKGEGKGGRDSRAMKCVEDFVVIRHEIKSRLSPNDAKTLDKLKSLTQSFISNITSNGVGIDSAAAGSSRNRSALEQLNNICSELIELDSHCQGSSGLSVNADISNCIIESLVNSGLTKDELNHVMSNAGSLFRDSIAQLDNQLKIINSSGNLTTFEQAQTRRGQEAVAFDLLCNALAESIQLKSDDVVSPGSGPEVKAEPSSQTGVNITINAPFTYIYHEGNQGNGQPGVGSENPPAAMTTDTTQIENLANPQVTAAPMHDMPEASDIEPRTLTNFIDTSEQDTQTPTVNEPELQPVIRGDSAVEDTTNEKTSDIIDAASGGVAQSAPTSNVVQDSVISESSDQGIIADDNARPSLTPASSYIGGPGSSSARANPAEARGPAQAGARTLNSQGSQWTGLDGKQASSVASELTYKESSFIGSRGSSQAIPNFGRFVKPATKE